MWQSTFQRQILAYIRLSDIEFLHSLLPYTYSHALCGLSFSGGACRTDFVHLLFPHMHFVGCHFLKIAVQRIYSFVVSWIIRVVQESKLLSIMILAGKTNTSL